MQPQLRRVPGQSIWTTWFLEHSALLPAEYVREKLRRFEMYVDNLTLGDNE